MLSLLIALQAKQKPRVLQAYLTETKGTCMQWPINVTVNGAHTIADACRKLVLSVYMCLASVYMLGLNLFYTTPQVTHRHCTKTAQIYTLLCIALAYQVYVRNDSDKHSGERFFTHSLHRTWIPLYIQGVQFSFEQQKNACSLIALVFYSTRKSHVFSMCTRCSTLHYAVQYAQQYCASLRCTLHSVLVLTSSTMVRYIPYILYG